MKDWKKFLKSLFVIFILAGIFLGLYHLLFDGSIIKVKEAKDAYEVTQGFIQKETTTFPKTADNQTQVEVVQVWVDSLQGWIYFLLFSLTLVVTSPILKWRGAARTFGLFSHDLWNY